MGFLNQLITCGGPTSQVIVEKDHDPILNDFLLKPASMFFANSQLENWGIASGDLLQLLNIGHLYNSLIYHDLPIEMVIVHSYVNVPEGKLIKKAWRISRS